MTDRRRPSAPAPRRPRTEASSPRRPAVRGWFVAEAPDFRARGLWLLVIFGVLTVVLSLRAFSSMRSTDKSGRSRVIAASCVGVTGT